MESDLGNLDRDFGRITGALSGGIALGSQVVRQLESFGRWSRDVGRLLGQLANQARPVPDDPTETILNSRVDAGSL